ncbi:histidine kinase N-terminal 7TM domain-containing diguanylate cyclase [Saccharibacillus sacchari]|uniref:Histidine kinase N-terminal 7TM domain-containing protein n=1 Tax=Saccharibacillus sacchari TaxID=456493 RepID=A0ACC6PFE7_9BACL
MSQQLLVYVSVILIGGALSLFLAMYAMLRFRNAPGGRYYILAALMASILAFGYAFELTSGDLNQIKFWIGIEYFSLPFLPVFTLLMCLEYTDMRLGPWKRRALFIIPMLTFVLQHTNEFHHLYYTSVGLRADAPFPVVELGKGPWYLVHTVYLYGCLAVSISVLLMRMLKARQRFRLQMLAMTAGMLVPVAGNLYYLAGKSPYGIDLGPVFISVSFVFHSMAIFRFRMFNVAPIAREIVFESMGDGVLVLNEQDFVVDYNPAMLRLVPELSKSSIGRGASEVLASHPTIAECVRLGSEHDLKLDTVHPFYVHARFAPIRDRDSRRSGRIVTFIDITERVVLEEKLKKLASTDGLTGLFNKNALIEKSEQALRELAPGGPGVSVIMFDVDHFKKVNDTFGHEAGDRVLAGVSDVIRRVLDGRGIAGRYGGDEFVLCLPQTCAEQGRIAAEDIRAGVERMEITVEGRAVRATSSFGVSHLTPSPHLQYGAPEMQLLMRRADHALYQSKKLGRNQASLYRDEESESLEAN